MKTHEKERKNFIFRLGVSVFIVSIWWLVALADALFDLNVRQFGVKPKTLEGLTGILTFPFIHGGWQHLLSNSLPGVILLTALFLFHAARSFVVLLILYLASGSILWLIGKSGSNHIGASGLVYALAFFLFTAGVIVRDRNSLAISFFIILWYGSMLWGIFPFSVEPGTSWEGHLGGAISGIVLALLIIKKPPKEIINDETPEDEHFFEKHRI